MTKRRRRSNPYSTRAGIVTRTLAPTNTRGTRVRAAWADQRGARIKSAVVSWDHRYDAPRNHRRAMVALVRRSRVKGFGRSIGVITPMGYVWAPAGRKASHGFVRGSAFIGNPRRSRRTRRGRR